MDRYIYLYMYVYARDFVFEKIRPSFQYRFFEISFPVAIILVDCFVVGDSVIFEVFLYRVKILSNYLKCAGTRLFLMGYRERERE